MKRFVVVLVAFALAAVTFASPALGAPVSTASVSITANDGAPIVLGAPAVPQGQANPLMSQTEVLGQESGTSRVCDVPLIGGLIKKVCRVVTNTVDVGFTCLTPAVVINFSGCKNQLGQLGSTVIDLVGAGISAIHKKIILEINKETRDAAVFMANWTLGNLLADDNELSSPDVTQDWFVEQASLLRNIGIFLIGPLMMIVVMQAIVKGSLFFLVRSFLVMLPVAILGSAVLIKFTDLMINIADDMSAAIGNSVLGGNGDVLTNNLANMDPRTMGFFSLVWLVMLLFGSVAIIIELLLRETGIYLAAFFLPMAFAALVWPSTSKWARRMVEVLLGLIFSKVFITAALTLGMAGMANVDASPDPAVNGSAEASAVTGTGNNGVLLAADVAQAAPAGDDTADAVERTETGTSSAAVISALFILSAFAGAKIISLSPGGDMALNQGRVAQTSAAWQKGQAVSAVASGLRNKAANAAAGVKPGGAWKPNNKPDKPKDTEVPVKSAEPRTKPQPGGAGWGLPASALKGQLGPSKPPEDPPPPPSSSSPPPPPPPPPPPKAPQRPLPTPPPAASKPVPPRATPPAPPRRPAPHPGGAFGAPRKPPPKSPPPKP